MSCVPLECIPDEEASDDLDEIARRANQKQDACLHRSNRCRFPGRGMKKPPEFGGFSQRRTTRRRRGPDRLPSVPIASLPRKKDEGHDQSRGDQHPVLPVNTKKCKTPNEKLHRSRPQFLGRISGLFMQDKRFGSANLLFILQAGRSAIGGQEKDLEPASTDSPFRKSSSACFPARCAARCDRKPPSHSLTPIGRRLRRISQNQPSC